MISEVRQHRGYPGVPALHRVQVPVGVSTAAEGPAWTQVHRYRLTGQRLGLGGSVRARRPGPSITPLAMEDVHSLLEVVLTGDVEDRLPRQLINRAAGNPLLLRELVRSGVDSGAIMRSQRVWRVAGDLPVGAGAADMIRGSLAELDAEELAAAQLIAVGEPLPLEIAEAMIGQPVMEGWRTNAWRP